MPYETPIEARVVDIPDARTRALIIATDRTAATLRTLAREAREAVASSRQFAEQMDRRAAELEAAAADAAGVVEAEVAFWKSQKKG